jgi:dTMP kinase
MPDLQSKIIMFDGPDGVGKTTQIEKARNELLASNLKVFTTRINGGSHIGEALRKVYLSNIERPAATDHYLGIAIYEAFIDELNRVRRLYDVILVDRSPLSNVAYQAFGSNYPLDAALTDCDRILAKLQADSIILFDAPLAVLQKRLGHATGAKADYFESQSEDFFSRVRQGYAFCAERYGIAVIDASADLETVHETTMRALKPYIVDA